MFPEDKIIEIFSMCDDFSKVFDTTVEKNAITSSAAKKRKYHRDGKMSDSEIMTILILFHSEFFSGLYLKFLSHRFGLRWMPAFRRDGFFL